MYSPVPYDRDFKLWANLYNESNTSRLDDVDVTLTVPLEYTTGGVTQMDGSKKYTP